VVAILASHTIAAADHVDTSIPGTPFDSTPGIFDTQLFIEVQLRGTMFPGPNGKPGVGGNAGQVNRPSKASSHPHAWQSFASQSSLRNQNSTNIANASTNQAKMQSEFKAAMLKLSLIGQNAKNMVDCSDVIPVPKPVIGTPHLPAGLNMGRHRASLCHVAVPVLTAQPGAQTSVAPVPPS
ncbi:heme peroxidase, partial [Mycena sp. CBHHK59/15]